jgi:APA family basic amino acid/polyamine antiporter
MFAGLLAGLVPLSILGELVSIGTLLAFAIVCAGILILRVARPNYHRPFKTPAVWIVAPLGMAMCIFMMAFLPLDTWLRLLVWTLIGLVIYFTYGSRNAKPPQFVLSKQPAE